MKLIMIMITLDYDFLGYTFFSCLHVVWDRGIRPQWEALKTAIAMDRNDVEARYEATVTMRDLFFGASNERWIYG